MAKRLTTKEFITNAEAIHGTKYDYSLVEYKQTRTKIKITCNTHGIFECIKYKDENVTKINDIINK